MLLLLALISVIAASLAASTWSIATALGPLSLLQVDANWMGVMMEKYNY